MWHVETDVFALAVFLIMLIKEAELRRERKRKLKVDRSNIDIQSSSFYYVLICSIFSVAIDIVASIAMNHVSNWWFYQISMTIYVASMPFLAAVWAGYAYVLIHSDYSLKRMLKGVAVMTVPYAVYVLVAFSNPFTGLFFRLSKTMEYARGIFFMPVGVGAIMFYSALGLLLTIINWRKIKPTSNALLLSIFFIITAVFTWVQLAHPGWLIINASYAVIYVWCDIAVEDERRKQLYREIRKKNGELKIVAQKAERAANAKSEFLSRMSHDIRTPMNAIIGLNHLAKREVDLDKIREYQYKIDCSSQFLLGLINDILDLSKIENGEMTLHEDTFTSEEFQNSIQTVIKPLIDEKNITFVYQMNSGIECINVDRLRFSQIFFNLLSNAAKFTPTGGMIEFISERIESEEEREDGKVGMRIYVRDNGIGMSEEFQNHMYDPFVQEQSELGDKARGTGLGLPIVKSLVDAMGGTIEVNSTLGKGTEFKIELYVTPAVAPEKENMVSYDSDILKDLRVLLVEDNELNVYVAKTILEQYGCIVFVANNGKEAVAKFEISEQYFYDAILMDVHMPVMDGMQATAKIRELARPDAQTVPIIAMTADAFDKEKQQILESGMNCHLAKPFDPQVLCEILAEYSKR